MAGVLMEWLGSAYGMVGNCWSAYGMVDNGWSA